MPRFTPTGIAYDRAGPRGAPPVVLLHAGIADRRMWDPQWPALTAERDAVRLDLRGFGDSVTPPAGPLLAYRDVLDTLDALDALDIGRCHVVGASYGASVAVETVLARPHLAASLLLLAPGDQLIPAMTPELRAFADAENAALARGDLDAATEANITWWLVGPHRRACDVDPEIVARVRLMQRRAFEITAGWGEGVGEAPEPDPPVLDRLGEITAPTTVLLGALDLDAIHEATRRVAEGVPGAHRVDWHDVAHLPSLERPADALALLRETVAAAEA